MTPTTLRFRARGTALVPNHELELARIRGFIGRKRVTLKPSDGEGASKLLGGLQLDEQGQRTGFAPADEPTEVPYRFEYVKACRDGDLWPADQATADACSVPFDPKFGAASDSDFKSGDKPEES